VTIDPTRLFARHQPQGDVGDYVRVVGTYPQFINSEFIGNRLVVEAAEFGAIPSGWDSHRVLFPADDFLDEYMEATDAEKAMRAVEQAVAVKQAAESEPERVSPWRRF
jgi:hypothetical protein